MPAAWVSVAKTMPRACIAATLRQSIAKPAEGGSNATGGPAIGVHTSQRVSGAGTCDTELAYQAGPDSVGPPLETEGHEPRVAEQGFDPRRERTESKPVSRA